MSIDLIAKNCDFSGLNMGFVPAVSLGLKYLNFYGKSKSQTEKNLADDSSISLIGNPEYMTNSARFTPYVNYLVTSQKQSPEMTILMCAKLESVNSALISTYRGLRNTGDGVASNGSSIWTEQRAGSTSEVSLNLNISITSGVAGAASENLGTTLVNQPVGWAFFSASVAADKRIVLRSHTTNSVLERTANKPLDINVNEFRIGGMWSASTFNAANEIAFCAIYDRALTTDEKAMMYNSIRAYMQSQGIAI